MYVRRLSCGAAVCTAGGNASGRGGGAVGEGREEPEDEPDVCVHCGFNSYHLVASRHYCCPPHSGFLMTLAVVPWSMAYRQRIVFCEQNLIMSISLC